MSLQQPSTGGAEDLESTAELPVLDVEAFEATHTPDQFSNTDTWVVPAMSLAAAAGQPKEPALPSPQPDPRLTQLENELHALQLKQAAFQQLEAELVQARLQRVAAERRTEELAAELSAVRAEARALAGCNADFLELIQTLEGRRGIFESLLGEYEQEIRGREDRIVQLQAEAAQVGGYESRLAVAQARTSELERDVSDGAQSLSSLQAQLEESNARRAALEDDLRVAEEAINRLEAELRGKNARIEELAKPRETPSSIPAATHSYHDPAPEGAVRLLIRSDGDSEVVHVLGRRTSIGRTPDNDVQIDAKYVSRHHAVLLAGPTYTVVEDLNSTNGVMVNGRRVTRHTLKDGDGVAIGRTQFRFVVRGSSR